MNTLVLCFKEFDPSLKESAAWALSYISKLSYLSRQKTEFASSVVEVGIVPLPVLSIPDTQIPFKWILALNYQKSKT